MKRPQKTVYAITSLPRERASADDLLALNRQHWAIENGLYWRRDTVFAEDRSRIRSNNASQAPSSLRNTVLRLLHRLQIPTRARRQIFSEIRNEAIKLVVQPLFLHGPGRTQVPLGPTSQARPRPAIRTASGCRTTAGPSAASAPRSTGRGRHRRSAPRPCGHAAPCCWTRCPADGSRRSPAIPAIRD